MVIVWRLRTPLAEWSLGIRRPRVWDVGSRWRQWPPQSSCGPVRPAHRRSGSASHERSGTPWNGRGSRETSLLRSGSREKLLLRNGSRGKPQLRNSSGERPLLPSGGRGRLPSRRPRPRRPRRVASEPRRCRGSGIPRGVTSTRRSTTGTPQPANRGGSRPRTRQATKAVARPVRARGRARSLLRTSARLQVAVAPRRVSVATPS